MKLNVNVTYADSKAWDKVAVIPAAINSAVPIEKIARPNIYTANGILLIHSYFFNDHYKIKSLISFAVMTQLEVG